MALNPEDWDGYGDEERTSRSPGKRRKEEKHFSEPVNQQKQKEEWEKIQKDSEVDVLKYIDSKWGEIKEPDEKDYALKVYFRWIKDSLETKHPILDDGDIKTERHDNSGTRSIHSPTLMGTVQDNENEAKKDLYKQLDNHLNIWKKTSPEFKKNTLGMYGKSFIKDVFDRI